MKELTIGNAKVQEILHWLKERTDEDTILDYFDKEPSQLTELDVIDYLVGVLESNLEYDFGFEYGLN